MEDIKSVIHTYATVEKIALKIKPIYASDLISINLITAKDPCKSAIIRTLSNLDSTRIDTYQEIQGEITLVQKIYADRQTRLQKVIKSIQKR